MSPQTAQFRITLSSNFPSRLPCGKNENPYFRRNTSTLVLTIANNLSQLAGELLRIPSFLSGIIVHNHDFTVCDLGKINLLYPLDDSLRGVHFIKNRYDNRKDFQ